MFSAKAALHAALTDAGRDPVLGMADSQENTGTEKSMKQNRGRIMLMATKNSAAPVRRLKVSV